MAAADYLILRALRESNGIAVTVTDEEMLQSCVEMARETGTALTFPNENSGILPAPEGGACLKAQQKLLEEGWIKPSETVILFNTGSLYKYSEAFKSIKL